MAEITLNALRKQKIAAEENIALVEENARKIQEQITALTPAEREKVEEIKEQIDLTDSQMLMQYGSGAKQNIADFSENILNNVRNKDTGYIGELMTGLVTSVQGLDFESLEKESGIMGIFKKAEAKVKRFMMQYEKLEHLGFAPYISHIVTSQEAGFEKPHPEVMALCIRKAGCAPEECVFVGDTFKKDVQGALDAGMHAVWYNVKEKTLPEHTDLAGKEYKEIRHFDELVPYIKSLA